MNGIDQLSIEDLERIDQKCCQFERELKRGNGVELGEYLAGTSGRERTTLLFELLALDIDYRQRQGRPLPPQDYEAIFPGDGEVIEKAFARSRPQLPAETAASANGATKSAAGESGTATTKTPTCIGRYRILTKIASGGFAVVYRGFDEELQRDVAIKIPHRNVISDGRHAERFMAEARLTASLNHPGIVPVYDVGRTEQGECYVVTKFMEGGDLSGKIRRNRPMPAEAAVIVAQIADALHTAHEQRLVHRDIKPSNILMDAHGGVYLADFGAAVQESSSNVIGFVGTPAYMSPEQARGEGHRVDFRTDVFALGVVLYELLTGLRPFQSQSVTQLLAEIIATDPTPPRQLNADVPAELERICMKAMSKRAADRYATAREFCWELREWNESEQQPAALTDSSSQLPVVPKGLRSFEATDAEFFLQLLPGPRDRHGLPESIRFWKARIEEKLPKQAFRVGVIFGPSGSGKSSLVKAGCLPRLPRRVRPIYVEAHATETEQSLEIALQKACGWEGKLPDLLRKARKGRSAGAPKIVIVIDQFEQWLHAQDDLSTAPLTAALRQCDGVNVQCLLLVRDDFWMSLVRFMAEIEVPLVDGENMMAVDLFDLSHAKKVLRLFGQAYEKLPDKSGDMTREQKQFIDDAITAIQDEGSVSPVRLSLFAEMMKHEPWEPATLRRVGGAEGLGVAFLERCFSRPESPPRSRAHAAAARDVLKALLPEAGVHIRGHFRPVGELLVASGYYGRPNQFEDLLRLLDQQLRLVTPINPEADATASENSAPGISPGSDQRFYQLTHDFMVEPIREWVTQGQRKTVRGRAELCLAERVSLWTAKPESRQLPGFPEWARIRLFTDSNRWTPPQRKMLRQAARRSLMHGAVVAAGVAVLAFLGWDATGRIRAKSALTMIRSADLGDLLDVIAETEPVRPWLAPLLSTALATSDIDVRDERYMRLALLRDDREQAAQLCRQALNADPREMRVLRDGLVAYADQAVQEEIAKSLWETLQRQDAEIDQRFRSACLLAGLAPASSQWNQVADDVAVWLVARSVDELADWLEALRPVSGYLVDPLERVFLEMESEGRHDIAAFALSSFLEDANHVERVVELIKRARPSQLPALINTLQKQGGEAVSLLSAASAVGFTAQDDAARTDDEAPHDLLLQTMEAARGVIAADFAICQMLPIEQLSDVLESLRELRYRPIRLRPFRHKDQLFVAAIWSRDDYEWKAELGIPVEQVRIRHGSGEKPDLGIDELAAYVDGDQWKFLVVWSEHPDALTEAQVTLIEPQTNWQKTFREQASARLLPHSYQLAEAPNGEVRRTQIWRRLTPRGDYAQRTNITADWLLAPGRGYVAVDLSTHLGWKDKPFGVVWANSPYTDDKPLILDNPEALLTQWSSLELQGFRPTAISMASDESRPAPMSVTVWQRPAPTDEALKRFADIKSNLTVSLLALGDTESTLPLLRHDADPTLRSYLIKKMATARVSVTVLQACLQNPSIDADVRQALILALGNYARSAVPAAERAEIGKALREIYAGDSDIGVRSAAEWTLRQWSLTVPSSETVAQSELGHRHWLVTSQGQTMAILDYPNDYEPEAATKPPTNHRFAISTKEVMLTEFGKFRPDHRNDIRSQGVESCPAHMMDWYSAAAYCNWLNEQEGIAQDEWCYQPNEEGKYAEGMTVASDFLARRGYRLPLASEWLYAASAKAKTRFFFGRDEELLDDFAWSASNSQGVHHSVGMLQPNLFGMFDVYGNVKEWSHTIEPFSPDGRPVPEGKLRTILGGCFNYFPRQFGMNYAKHGNPPELREHLNGFRIARTILSEPGD
jgi:serine/threonine protein kinase